MKTIAKYLVRFIKKDFHAPTYIAAFVGLAIMIALNYAFEFEDDILDPSLYGKWFSWPVYFLYYAIPYFFVIGLYALLEPKTRKRLRVKFWFKALFIFALLSFKVYFYFHQTAYRELVSGLSPPLNFEQNYAYARILNRVANLLIYGLGIVAFYKFFETDNKNWYGLKSKGFNWKPYGLMLVVMVPLISWAAMQADFQAVYPKLKMEYFTNNYWEYFAAYEALYMGEFFMVEWLFRGFLVVGMVKLLGHKAVLPMVVLYATFHFGKPLGECLGSILGGYALGVISYYSRSIWGGVIVHMGVAFLMDMAAIAAKLWV